MLAAAVAALATALVTPPPLPPPPADQLAAAQRLVAALPLTPTVREGFVTEVLHNSASFGLFQTKLRDSDKRWTPARDRMVAWMRTQLPADRARIDAAADECLAEWYGGGRSAADLDMIAAFYRTPAGQGWWPNETSHWMLTQCYADQLRPDWRSALIAAGIKPPPLPDPRVILY